MLAVALAVMGALLIALGSAVQERVVVRTRPAGNRRPAFLLHLVRQPRWWLGAVCAGGGVALHVVALSNGPVSVIQPVGISGLLFAMGIKALLDRRRIRPPELLGALAIVVGLSGLLLTLPHTRQTPPHLTLTAAVVLGIITLAIAGCAVATATAADSATTKAIALAFAAGTTFGVGSAMVGVIGHRVHTDLTAVLDWPTLLVTLLFATGGIAQQHAYRARRFALTFAMLEVTDPVTAATVGVLVLNEPLPGTPFAAAWMGLSATVVVVGVVVLARTYIGSAAEKSDHASADRD